MLKYFNNFTFYEINILIEIFIFYQCFYDYDFYNLCGNSNDHNIDCNYFSYYIFYLVIVFLLCSNCISPFFYHLVITLFLSVFCSVVFEVI